MWGRSRIRILESVRLARQYDLLTRLGPSDAAFDERPSVGLEKDRVLLSALLLVRDFLFVGTSNNNRKDNDWPQPATTHRPWMTGGGDRERLRTSIDELRHPLRASGLPRAPQLPPIPGLPLVDKHRAVPTRIAIDLDERILAARLQRPGRTLSGGTAFLVAGGIAAAWTGYFVVATWPPAADFTDSPVRASSEHRLVTPPSPQAALLELKGLAPGSEAEHDPRLTMPSENKLTESGIEGRSPQILPATEYTAKGETIAMPGSNSVHAASPRSSADAASDGQDTKPLIARERPFVAASVHDSTCFPSASAVRQDYPEAWPAWTLRAPGHEGTRCWYPATRTAVHDPRGEIMARALGETSAMPRSNSVHQASPRSSVGATIDLQYVKPLIERERPFVAASMHDSICFPSASAVRQDYSEAWPAWTLRAPGHEGTRCWYPARTAVHDPQRPDAPH
jgi:hypothetical protein